MKCLKCRRSAKKVSARGFCDKCLRKIEDEALAWQERDELAFWLRSRLNDDETFVESALTHYGHDRREVRNRVKLAKKLKVDWRHPPERMIFHQRREALFAKYGAAPTERGKAPKRKEAVA